MPSRLPDTVSANDHNIPGIHGSTSYQAASVVPNARAKRGASMKRVMTIEDLARLFGVHPSTVRRWQSESKKGKRYFPSVISPPGYKCLWSADEIMRFIESQSTSPVANTTVTSAKQQRRKAQDYQRRQEIAKAIIDAHRKTK